MRPAHSLAFGVLGLAVVLLAGHAAAGDDAGEVVGEIRDYVILDEDTLVDLARENDVGYVAMIATNPGVDPWLPQIGMHITLPTALCAVADGTPIEIRP